MVTMKSKQFLIGCAVAILALTFATVPARAQSSLGSVRGTVQDERQGLIPAADVTLSDTATSVALKTVTNAAGDYVFPAVVPGPRIALWWWQPACRSSRAR